MLHDAPVKHSLVVEERPLFDYQECLTYQKQLHNEVVKGLRADTLIICSHPPVITKGTSTKPEHITTPAEVFASQQLVPIEIGRGGSVTYHGPEQLVAYPILNLKHHKTDVAWYMRTLEVVVIETLRSFGVQGYQIKDKTGVWVRENAKIAFIGVKISRWCTYHGVSINVQRCAEKFALINPCGLGDIQVTSLQEESTLNTSLNDISLVFKENFSRMFNYSQTSPVVVT